MVFVPTVFGMGFNLAWSSSASFQIYMFKNMSMQQGQVPVCDNSEKLLLGTGKLLGALALTPLVSPPSLDKGP